MVNEHIHYDCGLNDGAAGGVAALKLQALPERYGLILCDIWGCVHDGVSVFREAESLLCTWRDQGRCVLLLTNAPRPEHAVRAQLDKLGLDRSAYDGVVTSGDTGLRALQAEGRNEAGFIGTAADRAALEATGLILLDGPQGNAIVCTGLRDGSSNPSDEDERLKEMRARGARLHCFNPDRVVHRGGIPEPCAGAIAERYEAMGGSVTWYGKPDRLVYEQCLARAGLIAGRAFHPRQVLAVGDSIATDFVGAAGMGFSFIFVTQGIEAAEVDVAGAEAVITRFMAARDIRLLMPLAAVPRLA